MLLHRATPALALVALLASCSPSVVSTQLPPPAPSASARLVFPATEEERATLGALRTSTPATVEQVLAWDDVAMGVVAREGFAPTTAAQLYASLAVAEREAALLSPQGFSTESLDRIVSDILCRFSALSCRDVRARASASTEGDPLSTAVLGRLDSRLATLWAPHPVRAKPEGPGHWAGSNPVTPGAGAWPLWVVDPPIDPIAPPPTYGSPEDLQQVAAVRTAAARVTPKQQEAVQFWAGSAGSETPAGIWLRRTDGLLRERSSALPEVLELRAALTMAVADAFSACWDAKFTYWTARPNERDATIVPLIPTPPFPSYPSGHATISGAAAEVLSSWDLAHATRYFAEAREAASSRLWAGIHFPIDNSRGLDFGQKMARRTLNWLHANG